MLSLSRRVALQPGRSATSKKAFRMASSSKTPLLTSFIVLIAIPSCQSSVASGATDRRSQYIFISHLTSRPLCHEGTQKFFKKFDRTYCW
jgi:hypothetical protein